MNLIDKDALVAEIENLLNNAEDNWDEDYAKGARWFVDTLQNTINTLEVKEVNLEKEIDNIWNPHFKLGWDDNSFASINHKSFESIAKHFFELGLNTQQNINIGITNIDKVIEENGVDPNSKEAKIFKESYYMALERLKAQKGETIQ